VAEELAGRVSRVDADGTVTPLVEGLASPEGIAFDPAGNLYVVEDVQDGRLLRVDPDGSQTELAKRRPEGVV
jgi:sugar lactone lactonase YvrE